MLIAHVNGRPSYASERGPRRGTCPSCAASVLARTGPIVAPHWAHVATSDCDPWAEPMTRWHAEWQAHAPIGQTEITIGCHRADVVTADGWIIEIQHSSLSTSDVAAREAHYGKRMVWIWDAREPYDEARLDVRNRNAYVTFRWKHPRKVIGACRRRVLLDLGTEHLLALRSIHTEAPCGGWGHLVQRRVVERWISRDAAEGVAA